MNIIIPDTLLLLVGIAVICSIFTVALVQKIKSFPIVSSELVLWIVNAFVSFGVSMPLSMYFFGVDIYASIWAALFTFIGAPALYDALKSFNPKSREELQIDTRKEE